MATFLGLKLIRSTTKTKAIFVPIILILISTSLFPSFIGCTEKEQPPQEETKQLVIPPDLEPEAVFPDFGEKKYSECAYDINDKAKKCGYLESWIKDVRMGKDLEKGYFRAYGWYILRDGKEIGPGFPLLIIIVFKYRTTLAAEQAFTAFAAYWEYEDLVVDGVKVKWMVPREMQEKSIYMLQSNNFIIHIDSSHEPAKDAVTRIIELYSVPINTGN